MASNITKDAAYYRYQLKTLARQALALKEAIDSTLDQMTADGVFYDGSVVGIAQDTEATNSQFAMQQLQNTLNAQKTNILKAADMGNAIAAPA